MPNKKQEYEYIVYDQDAKEYGGERWGFVKDIHKAIRWSKKSVAQNAIANHYGWAMRNTQKRRDNLTVIRVKRAK